MLAHQTSVSIKLTENHVEVNATSLPEILADIGELLAWLGAACRASPIVDNNCFCKVKPAFFKVGEPVKGDAIILCELDYTFFGLNIDPNSGDGCWAQLFRNVSVASGYSVPTRWNNEPGLEISTALMVLLGDTPWADAHNDNFMLKGFSSIFVPIKIQDGSVLWHYRRDPNINFIPYSEAKLSCIRKGIVTSADVSWVLQQRHFVGWTANAKMQLGSALFSPTTC